MATVKGRGRRAGSSTGDATLQTAATPWGPASVLEEVGVPQRSGDKRFTVVVQMLEMRDGERLIRFAYTTSGSARRGPVTMRARDLSGCGRRSSARPF
jgi:hypothetical protein